MSIDNIAIFFFFAGDKESVDEESESSPLVVAFCFLLSFLSFCLSALRFLLPIIQRIFLLIPVSFLTDRNRTFFQAVIVFTILYLNRSIPETLSMIKIFSGVQCRVLMRVLKILKCRYLFYDHLSSFRGQNWKMKVIYL